MKEIELVRNSWYLWNDPDGGICTKSVLYLGPGNEPGVVTVEDSLGVEFYVHVEELTTIPTEAPTVAISNDFDAMQFVPFMQFPNINNLRVSKTGYVLMVVNAPSEYDWNVRTPSEFGFNLTGCYRLALENPREVNGERLPPEPTICIGFQGGHCTFTAGKPEKTKLLYDVLYKLRLYFMGFLELPIEDESDIDLTAVQTPQRWVVPSELMSVLIKHYRAGIKVALRSKDLEEVSAYANHLRGENLGYQHDVEMQFNADGEYYFIRVTICMNPVISMSNMRLVEFDVDETYNHAMRRLEITDSN